MHANMDAVVPHEDVACSRVQHSSAEVVVDGGEESDAKPRRVTTKGATKGRLSSVKTSRAIHNLLLPKRKAHQWGVIVDRICRKRVKRILDNVFSKLLANHAAVTDSQVPEIHKCCSCVVSQNLISDSVGETSADARTLDTAQEAKSSVSRQTRSLDAHAYTEPMDCCSPSSGMKILQRQGDLHTKIKSMVEEVTPENEKQFECWASIGRQQHQHIRNGLEYDFLTACVLLFSEKRQDLPRIFLNVAPMLDTGGTDNVICATWANYLLEKGVAKVECEPSYYNGMGDYQSESLYRIRLFMRVRETCYLVDFDVVGDNIVPPDFPILLSKNTMQKAELIAGIATPNDNQVVLS